MNINWFEVLKWVGIVFAAGFVGYFGKYLSKVILGEIKKEKSTQNKRRT